MAAQARLRATDDALAAAAAAVPLCLLHDLVGAAAFLASHPLHAAYLLFFARHLAALAAFFCPLLVSTALLLAVLATVSPYLGGGAEWPVVGRTCGIAVAALCAEFRPDGGGDGGLVAQLCTFVLGPGDAAAVDRVGEIVGELCCDITGSYYFVVSEEEENLLQLRGDKCKEQALEAPLMNYAIDERSYVDHEDSGDIDDKVVISEDWTGSESLAEQCCQSSVQEMKAEEEVGIQKQGLISSDMMDHVADVIVDKRLECDPVPVEIKKCEPVQAMEMEIKKSVQAQAMEVEEFQTVAPKGIKAHSSISRRIRLWEAQVSGNFKRVIEEKKDISVKFSMQSESTKDVKNCVPFETDLCGETCDRKLKARDTTSTKESEEQEHGQEFKDVKECVPSETERFIDICSRNSQAEENAPASHTEQIPKGVQPEAELQEQECGAEQDTQVCQVAQPEQDDLQEVEEYKDVTESPVVCNERESSLKSTSIAGRVHSRTSSENLISDVSPSHKEKEWKRTLACKLYEERMQLKLCRDRAVVVEGSDNMDMLWEAYEVGGSGSGVKQGGVKGKSSKKVELVEEDDEESEEQDDDDGEGSVSQLCCLQALKFSTKKMRFGGGKPSLARISKVLKRMTVLSRVRSHKS